MDERDIEYPGGEKLRAIAFNVAPCRCVKRHHPHPQTSELHHVFPESWQRQVYGKVISQEKVPLCGTAHNNVHVMLDSLRRGGRIDARGNDYLRDLAHKGWAMYQAAQAGG